MPGYTMGVILAAGGGTRLRPLTDERPKCLLEIGGRPLLDYQLQALAAQGIEDVLVVTGHFAEQVTARCAGRARTLYNPDYAATNNLHSLWVARQQIAGRDFLCLHADVLFHPGILRPCLESTAPVCVILDRAWVEETMKARVEDNRVVEISKAIPPESAFGTFLGIAHFSASAASALADVLDSLVREKRNRQKYFTACLPALATRGFLTGYVLTGGKPWIEIDFEADLRRAASEVLPLLPSPAGSS